MIEFPMARIERVRAFLAHLEDDDGVYERVHRVLAQSYKAGRCADDVAGLIGALSYLLTGEPEEFARLGKEDGLRLAERLLIDGVRRTASRSLLLDHARTVLTVEPVGGRRSSYIDYEADHLVLLGGRDLFFRVVEALTRPYREFGGFMEYWEATTHDLAMWVRPEVVDRALADEPRRWKVWDDWRRRHQSWDDFADRGVVPD